MTDKRAHDLYARAVVRCPSCGSKLAMTPRSMDQQAEWDRLHACVTCRVASPCSRWIEWPA